MLTLDLFIIVWFKSSKWTKSFISHQTDNKTLRWWRPSSVWSVFLFSLLTVFGAWHFFIKPIPSRFILKTRQQREAHIYFLRAVRLCGKFVRNPLTQFADFSDGTHMSMNDQIQTSRVIFEQLQWDFVLQHLAGYPNQALHSFQDEALLLDFNFWLGITRTTVETGLRLLSHLNILY